MVGYQVFTLLVGHLDAGVYHLEMLVGFVQDRLPLRIDGIDAGFGGLITPLPAIAQPVVGYRYDILALVVLFFLVSFFFSILFFVHF